VEDELEKLCTELIKILDNNLLNKASVSADSKVYYLKMKADYYRYMGEFLTDCK
jgi:14-3-3 protein epsilon